MKRIFIAASILVSFSALADNSDLEAIFRKYESTLMNIKVGMTSHANTETIDFEVDENGNMTTKLVKRVGKTVILKVEGSRAYEYVLTKNIATGDEEVTVHLNDYNFKTTDSDNISNVKVVKDILSADFSGGYADQYSSYEFKGAFTKELLSPMFCGRTHNVAGKYTDHETGKTYPIMDNQINKCGAMMAVADIKKIDLTVVEFCDTTLPDETEQTCTERDMSFLTADL